MMFGGNFAIRGWELCNGQTLPISQYTALFSILGTTFGGNGTTTFCLPDLRGRVPLHWGQGPGTSNYSLGQSSGSENVTISSNQMPTHNHLLVASTGLPDSKDPTNHYLAPGARDGSLLYATTSTSPANLNPATVSTAGGSQPLPILQPYLSVTFLIAMVGIFPSRN